MNRTLASRSAETQVLGSGPAEALLEGIPLLLRPLDASGGAIASWELDNPSRVVVHGLRVRQPGLPDGELISARNMQLQHGLARCHSGLLLALVAPDVERRRTGPGTAAEPTAYPPRSRAPSSRRMCAELAGFPPLRQSTRALSTNLRRAAPELSPGWHRPARVRGAIPQGEHDAQAYRVGQGVGETGERPGVRVDRSSLSPVLQCEARPARRHQSLDSGTQELRNSGNQEIRNSGGRIPAPADDARDAPSDVGRHRCAGKSGRRARWSRSTGSSRGGPRNRHHPHPSRRSRPRPRPDPESLHPHGCDAGWEMRHTGAL